MFYQAFNKTAALTSLKPPKTRMAPKFMAKGAPARVTTDLQPLNPINGLGGVTGTPEMASPMARPVGGGFGRFMRKSIVSRTAVKKR